jgi:hypothetical protein
MNEKENEKDNERIRRLAREGKIEFAPDDQIGYLRGYIDRILQVIADVTGIEKIADALVSDESSISDFLIVKTFGPPGKFEKYTDEEFRKLIAEISEELDVELNPDDKASLILVEVAKKLAHG